MHAQWSSQGCACAESVCVTRLQCASPALASRHNPWDTLTHAIASNSPGLDAPSFQIDRNDWPFLLFLGAILEMAAILKNYAIGPWSILFSTSKATFL